MQTLLTSDPTEAAALIRRGEIVAFPTETVYGLGADLFNETAVRKVFAAKGRPADNPLIAHVERLEQIEQLAARIPDVAQRLIDQFFPGPLTIVLPRRPDVPAIVSAGLPTIGVRMPRHPVAQAFLKACGRPVAAPSANRSGRPSPTTWQAVQSDLDGRIACILQGDRSDVGLESTVVDCSEGVLHALRAGAVTLEALQAALPDIRLTSPGVEALRRSPGTRHRHYAPRARVHLIDDPEDIAPKNRATYIGLTAPPDPRVFVRCLVCPDVWAYAHAFFDFFRQSDRAGARSIYAQRVEETGLGVALMDRLRRAAEAAST